MINITMMKMIRRENIKMMSIMMVGKKKKLKKIMMERVMMRIMIKKGVM